MQLLAIQFDGSPKHMSIVYSYVSQSLRVDASNPCKQAYKNILSALVFSAVINKIYSLPMEKL